MKAGLCMACRDVLAPLPVDGSWRVCQCGQMALRWTDGATGMLEVSSRSGPDGVRVIGLNNAFLEIGALSTIDPDQWRGLHQQCSEAVDGNYLFHTSHRDCWAVIVKVGESGDVTYTPWDQVEQPKELTS